MSPVLLAHGEAAIRGRLRRLLAHQSNEVLEVRNGREAIVQALVRTPALLVTELRLPLVDGYTLCDILRRDPSTASMPILAIDTVVTGDEPERARRAGASAFLEPSATAANIKSEARRLIAESHRLRARSAEARVRADAQLEKAAALLARSERERREWSLSHAPAVASVAPVQPPSLACPSCGNTLAHRHTHVGGASPRYAEQWDQFVCARCGVFEYRHRTRSLRPVMAAIDELDRDA